MTKRRIFIAIPIPQKLKDRLLDYSEQWQNIPGRWTKPENLHLTLIPPMYLDDDEISRVVKAVGASVSNFEPFDLEFEKVIYGPPGKPSRMIWLLGKRNEKLSELKSVACEALLKAEVPYQEEMRQLTPHITLCRMYETGRRKFESKPKIEEAMPYIFQVDALTIMESKLKRNGAEYVELQRIKIGE